MFKTVFSALALAAGVHVAMAAVSGEDAIKARRELMKSNGDVTKPIVPMLQGKAAFDLATVQKALRNYVDVAAKMPNLFPPDSKTGDTHALPVIWEDNNMPDLDARFKKLGADAEQALASVKDAASFKAVMPGFYQNCGGCHDKYRAKLQ